MPAAIYYDGYEPAAGRPVGIDVATDEFTKAFIRYAKQDELYCVTPSPQGFQTFRQAVGTLGGDASRCVAVAAQDAGQLERAGCYFRYDPAILEQAWLRRHDGQRRYSICGITHTSATHRVMDLAGGLVTAPTQSWDALVCASHAIKSAVGTVMEGWADYLGRRFGAPPPACPMQFPVIPLGVDAERFAAITTAAERSRQRAQLGLGDADTAVLFVGRLSHYAKANPLPLLVAMEQAAATQSGKIHLLFFGYFDEPADDAAFREAAQRICDNVQVIFLEHGDAAFPDGAWAGADNFCSPVDNIQESFGLTPVEAMAASLPVVASDWDGYRDTVRHGVDGFLIPTSMPAAGAGGDLALRHFLGQDGYGEYLAAAAQATAVDVDGLTQALIRLIENPGLRRDMGEAGRRHVADTYDWPHIIRAYEELWAELDRRRAADPESAPRPDGGPAHPLRPDPFLMFRDFATVALDTDTVLEMATDDWDQSVTRLGLKVSMFNPSALIELEDLPLIIGQIEASGSSTVGEITTTLEPLDRNRLIRTLGWLVKLGICRRRSTG